MRKLKNTESFEDIKNVINEEMAMGLKYENYLPNTELVLLSKSELDSHHFFRLKRSIKFLEGGDKKFANHVLYEMLKRTEGSVCLTYNEPSIIEGEVNVTEFLICFLFNHEGFDFEFTDFTTEGYDYFNLYHFKYGWNSIYIYSTNNNGYGKREIKVVIKGSEKFKSKYSEKIDNLHSEYMQALLNDEKEFPVRFLKSIL